MGDALVEALAARCAGTVAGDAPLAPLTTLRVGGPARVLVTPQDDDDLAAVAEQADEHGVEVLVLGRGSNLLVHDAGWPGIAVVLGRGFAGTEIVRRHEGGADVRVGAAEPMPKLAVTAAAEGLGEVAWAVGVPGSVGGGVRMNAGAHGGEMVDVVVEAELFRLGSRTREIWPAAMLGFGYRHTRLPSDAVVVATTLRLPDADPAKERAELDEVRRWRREHQPLEHPNCGSVFRNPPGDAAGRLIDVTGLRGLRHGGARVSDKHANFIVTEPGATAADVLAVLEEVRSRVADVHGVRLVSELVVVGGGASAASAGTDGAGP